ncbi:MAG: HlyD family efflux transporter periplasmic adaptor subunit [Gemmatimonadota bacterium]
MNVSRRTGGWMAAGLAAGLLLWLVLRPERVAVEVVHAARGALRVTLQEDGETRVKERYLLSAPVAGRLVRLECEPGQRVAAGDVLARIFPLPLDTRAQKEAAGRLAATEAGRAAAEAAVQRAEVAWDEARRYLGRLERAGVEGGISLDRLDRARAAEQQAALALEQARRTAEASAHEVETARASVMEVTGERGLSPVVVRAPADGRVLRLFEECERAVSPGAPILEVGDTRDLEVVVDVLSEDVGLLTVGAQALIVPGPEADTLRGRIERIEPTAFTRVSPLGVEEQRVNVIITFEGEAPLVGDRFRVEASLITWESDDVLMVPLGALFRRDSRWAVYAVADGRARLRIVEIGHRGQREAEVTAGISEGETVVVYPPDGLREGARVHVIEGS